MIEKIISGETMTLDEWRTEGKHRFGSDPMQWRFVCPSCGHVASVEDWKNAGAPETAVAFSCIGRWLPNPQSIFEKPGPCNYAGGGLFGLNPVRIEGRPSAVFSFAESKTELAKKEGTPG
jgi:hypothetical protein